MSRAIVLNALALTAAISVSAHAGIVPEGASKDVEAGYCHRALGQIQPLLADHVQDAELQFRYGQALSCIKKADDAIAALKIAISLDPKNGVYHRALGEAYGAKAQQGFAGGSTGMFGMMGLMKSARAEFESAAQLAPTDVQSHVDLAMYYIMVPGLLGGSYSKAHAEEEIIDKLDPIQGLQVRANEAGNKDDIASGALLLKQAAAMDKTDDSLIALGLLYAGGKQYDAAFQTFRDVRAKDPEAYMAWYQIGKTAGLAKANYDEGIDALKHYIAVGDALPDNLPSLGFAHLRLGDLYADQGKLDQAKAEYQIASSLNETDGDPELTEKLKDAQSGLK